MRISSRLHRIDPRVKVLLQLSVVAAAYAYTDPLPLLILSIGTVWILWIGNQSLAGVLWEFRYLIVFLSFAPLIGGATMGQPWFDPASAREPGLAAIRVVLLVIISIAIVRTTTPREIEAAIRWALPGRLGRATGLGVGLVFRLLPVLKHEAATTRRMLRARGGEQRPVYLRMQLLGILTLVRCFRRTDRITRALLVRCLSWNSTVPTLALRRHDGALIVLSVILLAIAVWPWVATV